ncbi:GNAT family N-acetyltransferase [Halobacillus yeomjeoni]|uniref:GNAT family N-acetyltransferase n=1 Tax=Halobacillus yeomjeoni TaxID=311194 RepID=A0A931MTN0_9BACI|nr:GNAT family N-acetyltransferase [Halobacillus yeomjeoni]MBH0229018.1 GNAT family N-acetyltransferase [Halobacillus yeomjeoni]
MNLRTPRLHLIPINLELAQTLMKNSLAFYYMYQIPWNKNWPHPGLKALLPIYSEKLERDETEVGFGPWVIMDINGDHVIGDIGFKGKPDGNGIVEMGYHIVASERNMGFASEAVDHLCQWAFKDPEVKGVEAQCDKNNIASQKVLINNGFYHTKRDRNVLVFKKVKNVKYTESKKKKEL